MLKYIFAPGTANEKVLSESEIISHNPVRVHTGLSDLSATIVENRDLDAYAQRQDRLNVEVDGNVVWTGYLIGLSHTISEGRSRLRADGIAKRLKETRPDYNSLGGSLTYSSISLEDALRDYWARTPFDNFSVTPQSTETVATDTQLQSADTSSEWSNITTIEDTTPVRVNNGLELTQTCWTTEAEDGTTSGTIIVTADRYSGNAPTTGQGDAVEFTGSGQSCEITFTVNHTIPESNVSIDCRYESNNSPAINVSLNGDTWEGINDGGTITNLEWQDIGDTGTAGVSNGYQGGDLTPGTYTIQFESTSSGGTDARFDLDVVAVNDNRYSYTFDNTTSTGSDGGSYLDGPELYPSSLQFKLQEENASFNISEADVNSTWNDTSNNQAIGVSNDGGETYTTFNNTSSLTHTFSSSGRTGQVRFTFSRYGGRTTATPQTGFNGQYIDDYELLVDGNDLIVIDNLDLARNHFENLQQLHQYGGNWNWTIEHDDSDIANITVTSYQQGDETRAKPSEFEDPISESAEVQAEAYFNSIYLQGALDSAGDRPTAEVDDQTAINNDGRVISPGVLRDPKVTTEDGALFRARALLETAQSNNDLVGSKTLPSDTIVEPGYQYPVDFGQGDNEKTLEEVSLSESPGDVNIRVRFSTPKTDFSSQIENLRRDTRDIGDNV